MARKKAVTAADTQHTIITTAQRLFMTHGYRAVSTRKIAQEAGITQPALYHHFKNKQAIYVEVVRTIMQRTEQSMNSILQRYPHINERLWHITRYMIIHHQEDLTQMFHDMQYEIEAAYRETIQSWWNKSYFNPVLKTLNEGIESGEIRIVETASLQEMTFFLLEMMKAFLPQGNQSAEAREAFADQKAALLVEMVFNGLKK